MKNFKFDELLKKIKKPASKKFRRISFTNRFTQKFSWDEIINNLFSPIKRPGIHKLFLFSTICIMTYVTGKIIALGVLSLITNDKPKGNISTSQAYKGDHNNRKALAAIKNANLFNTPNDGSVQATTQKPKVDDFTKKKCFTASQTSSLPITLLSTTVMQDSVKSVASVQVRNKKDHLGLHEGDLVSGMAEIGKITRLKLIIKNLQSGKCEYIENKEKMFSKAPKGNINVVSAAKGKKLIEQTKMDGIKNVGNNFEISKKKRDELLKDVGSLLTQARGIPINNPDGTMSFKIVEVAAGGLFSHLGITDNDVITNINGKPIKSMAEVMDLFGRFKDIDSLSLGISRDGVESNQEYTFK